MSTASTTVLSKIGGFIAIASLLLALLAFFPSIAPFTPAILVSALAFSGALIGAACGWLRVAILTIYVVIATFLVSPISSWIEHYIVLALLVKAVMVIGVLLAASLLLNYIKSVRQAR